MRYCAIAIVLISATQLRAQSCTSPPLSEPSFYGAGGDAAGVAIGDLDGNGTNDIVVARPSSNSIAVLFNDGTGAFGPPQALATETTPVAVAIADFNHDGFNDLAVANSGSNTISIFLGIGAGAFGPPSTLSTEAQPSAVVTGDFNGDGFVDLAVADTGANDVQLFYGTGTGSFGAPVKQTNTLLIQPVALAVGRLDADNRDDLIVVGNGGTKALIFYGGSPFAGGSFTVGSAPVSVALGEFAQDTAHTLDAVVANEGSNNLTVQELRPGGVYPFSTTIALPGAPSSVAVADFNGDHRPDLLVFSRSMNELWLLYNSGYLQFSAPIRYQLSVGSAAVAVGDVNGDGHPDAVASMPTVNGLSVLRGANWPVVSKPYNRLVTILSAPVFTDDPLVAGVTIIKAIHLSEVRDAVNMMRAKAGLVAVPWTDAASPGLTVKAVHVTELRNALTPALTALMRSAAYTDPNLAPGDVIKAVHIQEIRDYTNNSFALTVNLTGSGTGTVLCAVNGGANGTCAASYNFGSSVVITATASTGSAFTSWTGCDSTSTNTCTVGMTVNKTVTAAFTLVRETLTITRSGNGTGAIADNQTPAVLTCPTGNTTCTASYDYNTSVTLTATAGTGSTFSAWSSPSCTGTGTCTVSMTAAQTVTATFTLVQETLTITKVGIGTVQCVVGTGTPGACAPSYTYNTQVTIQARPNNGSGAIFGGFGGACSGIVHDCMVTMTSPLSVTVNFVAAPYNVVFVSSQLYPGNLGSARAYDGRCNGLATAAGINNAFGNAFIAMMTDAASPNAISLFGVARGFIRLDGAYISDLLTDIYQGGRIMNPIDLDETGRVQADLLVYTGTNPNGATSSGNNCANWTGGTSYLAGITSGGPSAWTAAVAIGGGSCVISQLPIYCFEKDRTTPLAPVSLPPGAKRIYLLSSPTFLPGGGISNADNVCNLSGNKGPLTGTYKALLSTSSTSAATHALLPGASYYTTDSLAPQLIGTGSQIAGGVVNTGIWPGSNGSYSLNGTTVWTGSTTPGVAGNGVSTCNDWNAGSGNGAIFGWPNTLIYGSTLAAFWSWSTADCGASNLGLYCAEQ